MQLKPNAPRFETALAYLGAALAGLSLVLMLVSYQVASGVTGMIGSALIGGVFLFGRTGMTRPLAVSFGLMFLPMAAGYGAPTIWLSRPHWVDPAIRWVSLASVIGVVWAEWARRTKLRVVT